MDVTEGNARALFKESFSGEDLDASLLGERRGAEGESQEQSPEGGAD